MPAPASSATIEAVRPAAYTIPTSDPVESDGTLEWDSTTMVVVHAEAGGRTGLGWAYTHAAAARVIADTLRGVVEGRSALAPESAWDAMRRAVRNIGSRGVAASALSAVDIALWDLKARLLDVAVSTLLGRRRDAVPVYGSGGFTSLSVEGLREQLAGWVDAGIPRVKMKVGRDPVADPDRVAAARDAVGPDAALFVDANGAYDRKQALDRAARFAEHDVSWFEEPVSSDDRDGLRLIRDRAPAGMDITAGEYGWTPFHFRDLIAAGAVDVAQPDATRCGGFTGFLRIAGYCTAHHTPISAHTAPQLHAHVGAAAPGLRHVELFHDHDRIERMLLDGWLEPEDGALHPDPDRPGLGLTWKASDAEEYRI